MIELENFNAGHYEGGYGYKYFVSNTITINEYIETGNNIYPVKSRE